MFEVRSIIKIPDDVIYHFSVDEWRTYLSRKHDISPDTINSFDDVAKEIGDLWYADHYDYQKLGIIQKEETRRVSDG